MPARSMNIVPNLPYIDEHSSNYQYIILHMKKPQVIPALCSKCSSTTKYFGLTESVKDVGHWKKAPENTILLNIESYEIFKNTLGGPIFAKQAKITGLQIDQFWV